MMRNEVFSSVKHFWVLLRLKKDLCTSFYSFAVKLFSFIKNVIEKSRNMIAHSFCNLALFIQMRSNKISRRSQNGDSKY